MTRSLRPLRVAVAVVVFAVVSLSLTGCVADPAPQIFRVTPGVGQVEVGWSYWPGVPQPVAYVVTPWVGSVPQTPVRFDSPNSFEWVTGLTNGVTYTFTVRAINALGNDSAESAMSDPVTPFEPPVSWTVQTTPTCPSLHGDSINGGSEQVRIEFWSAPPAIQLLVDDPVDVEPGHPFVENMSTPPGEDLYINSVAIFDLDNGGFVGDLDNVQAVCTGATAPFPAPPEIPSQSPPA